MHAGLSGSFFVGEFTGQVLFENGTKEGIAEFVTGKPQPCVGK